MKSAPDTPPRRAQASRRPAYSRNPRLSRLLTELNELLAPTMDRVVARHETPELPIVLVMGCPRSGTTLALQWLASLGVFSYPTNLLSRFYAAPYVGALVQRMLVDPEYQFRDELLGVPYHRPDFGSALGKTTGLLAPNEFWYFWRRHFAAQPDPWLPAGDCIDRGRLLAELASLQAGLGGLPFAAKGLMFNWRIPELDALLPRAVFINLRRDPILNMQSLLAARREFYGDIRSWYSFKPPQLSSVEQMDPYEQVAAQVTYTRTAVEQGLDAIAGERGLTVDYETLCRRPHEVYAALADRLGSQGVELPRTYTGPIAFAASNRATIGRDERRRLERAYEQFARI